MYETEVDFIIIGSGPSSFSCLSAIPDHFRVNLIDIDERPKPDTMKFSNEVAAQIKENNEPQILDRVFRKVFDDNSMIGDFKKFFGDDFSYDAGKLSLDYQLNARASVGMGGFSAVWGSTVLPFSNFDFRSMSPSLREHFQKGYREIAKSVIIEGNPLGTEAYLDFSNQKKSFTASDLSQRFLGGKFINQTLGKLLGSYFMPSAVMVGESEDSEVTSCIECGLCHVGCPFGLIWNSSASISKNQSRGITRITGTIIRFDETNDYVSVEFISNGVRKVIHSKHLLLSGGPISTSKLILQSIPLVQSVFIDDSQTFFRHAFSLRKIGSLRLRNTLAELMLSIESKGKTGLLAQLYSRSHYSDFRAQKELRPLKKMPEVLRDFALSRLITLLIYLPGESSNKLEITRQGDLVKVSAREEIGFKLNTFQTWMKLWISMLFKGVCIVPLVGTKLSTGGGNHIGRARLMLSESVVPVSNSLGQLYGHRRVYVVDGSSLPAVPAGPITYSIMANANQIVSKLVKRL